MTADQTLGVLAEMAAMRKAGKIASYHGINFPVHFHICSS